MTIYPLFTWRSALVGPDSTLSPEARHVALTLSLHMSELGDSCFPGQRLLTQQTGYGSKNTVVKYLDELEEKGWLEVTRPARKLAGGPGCRSTNTYRAVIPEPSRKGHPGDPLPGFGKGHERVTKGSLKGHPGEPEDVEDVEDVEDERANAREADDYAEFWKFWQVYPSRDGKKLGKGKAEAKFNKTPRRERDAIAVGVRNYRDAIDQGLAFGPKDAHRWLNDRDWLDWQTPAKPDPNRRRKTPNEQAFEEFSEDPDWRAAFDDLNGSGKAGAVSQGRLPEGSVEPGPDEGLHPGNGGLGRGGSSYGHSGMGQGTTTPALDRRYQT